MADLVARRPARRLSLERQGWSRGLPEAGHRHRGPAEVLFRTDVNHLATDWSPDGRFLALQSLVPGLETTWDIWTYSFEQKAAKPFVQSAYAEVAGAFSPDGRWLAYASDESGRSEVYVQPFPGPGSKSRVSTAGGVAAALARGTAARSSTGSRGGRFMAVPVTARDGAFDAGTPAAAVRAARQRHAGHPIRRDPRRPAVHRQRARAGRGHVAADAGPQLARAAPALRMRSRHDPEDA